MKKEFSKTGKYGTASGYVEVIFNSGTTRKTVHNPSTHDDDMKTFNTHSVVSYFNGKQLQRNDGIIGEQELERVAKTFEGNVWTQIEFVVDVKQHDTLHDKFKKEGYK